MNTQLDLTLDSPAFVSQMVTEAVQKSIAREMEIQFPALRGGGRGQITAGVRNAMKRNRTAVKLHPKWNAKCKA